MKLSFKDWQIIAPWSMVFVLLLALISQHGLKINTDALAENNLHNTSPQKMLIPYNQKIYDLSYQTFLAIGNLTSALEIAQAAVKQQPNNLLWRERLAIVANWTQHPRLALQQWQYLAQQGKTQTTVLDHIIDLSLQLKDEHALLYALKIKLKNDPDNEEIWQQLIAAYERLGTPQVALSYVEKLNTNSNNKNFALIAAKIYQATGQSRQELLWLDKAIQKQGIDTRIALRQAEIFYNQGDISNALKKLLAAKSVAKNDDASYWDTLSSLSWLNQNQQNILYAIEKLRSQNLATAEQYRRLIMLLQPINSRYAFELAQEGWEKYHQPSLYINLIELGSQLKEWSQLKVYFEQLTPQEKLALIEYPAFWSTTAQFWQELGYTQQAQAIYQEALAYNPTAIEIKINYINFLIQQQDIVGLQAALIAWQKEFLTDPELSNIYKQLLDGLLSSALATQNYGLTNYLFGYYQLNYLPITPLLAMQIALQNNDLPLMQTLLINYPTQVAAIDANTAARRLGYFAVEQEVAYQTQNTLAKSSQPFQNLYEQLSNTLLDFSNNINLSQQVLQYGALGGAETKVAGKYYITPSLALLPYTSLQIQRTRNNDALINVPRLDQEAGINFEKLTPRSMSLLGASIRKAVDTFLTAFVGTNYQWTTHFNVGFLAGYNQKADETTSLLVAGAKNLAQLTANYQFDNKNFLLAQVEADQFRSQTGSTIGLGNVVSGEFDHRFNLEYPDLKIRAFGSVHNYTSNSYTLPNTMATLVPTGQIASTQFYIPESYSQWGMGISIGELYQNDYTTKLRPFISTNVFYNTSHELGYDTSIGLATRLFGNDQFSLYASINQGTEGNNQIDSLMGIRYKFLF